MRREVMGGRKSRAVVWIWSGVFGLTLVVIVVFLHLRASSTNSHTSLNIDQPPSETELDGTTPIDATEVSQVVMKTGLTLPPLDFPPGSVEEACGFNDFLPYHSTTFESDWDSRIPLASEKCWSAMETHINTINPLHLERDHRRRRTFLFVVLGEPLTFERIFSDPQGDLLRVQDALSRTECLLTGDETNWELKDSCHAEAFLNYALINRICLGSGWSRAYTYYLNNDDLTPEQDRLGWKESLEREWVEMKCEELDQTLEFSSEQYPELHKLVISFQNSTTKVKKNALELLIELSARLGDEAAGLSLPRQVLIPRPGSNKEEGYKFGRFTELLASRTWQELTLKQVPNADRFYKIFHMLARAESQNVDTLKAIRFDWGQLVQHMCIPPSSKTLEYISDDGVVVRFTEQDFEVMLEPELEVFEDFFKPKSCQEIVHEIRQQRGIKSPTVLAAIEKFEQVALEMGVYE
ncbi:MAG: hypothetical protein F4227_09880 [Gammaproteobacteria bacterium]|nr:hypothetical protein [Gammaproteobacteria bacterium]MYF03249.1 hypothetical protein [Gammaproteobacteria bacterium]MYI76222.1 hypothetical protein [Gammaproteobacteria bacterium]